MEKQGEADLINKKVYKEDILVDQILGRILEEKFGPEWMNMFKPQEVQGKFEQLMEQFYTS